MVDIIKDKVIRAGVFEEVSFIIIEADNTPQHIPLHIDTHFHNSDIEDSYIFHTGGAQDGRHYHK